MNYIEKYREVKEEFVKETNNRLSYENKLREINNKLNHLIGKATGISELVGKSIDELDSELNLIYQSKQTAPKLEVVSDEEN